MKAVDTIDMVLPDTIRVQAGHMIRERELERLLVLIEQGDTGAYQTLSRTIETMEQLSVGFLQLETQLTRPTTVPEGLAWMYRSYFSMLDDSIGLLFTQICQEVIPQLRSACSKTSEHAMIQQEFDFSI